MNYHQIYTDTLEVVGRDPGYGDDGAIKVRYKYDAGGVNSSKTFWITDDGARSFIEQLEDHIEDDG